MPDGADAAAATGSAPVPLASALAGGPTSFVRADVALGSEPVIGSFTVDGMTFAVVDGGSVELVGIAPGSQPGDPSEALAVPASVSFEGVTYAVSSIGAYAFYLSGVTSVALPASVGNVDERAFRSSDVAFIEADPASESFASFDGALYSADLTRLLLIPGGRQGAVRIPSQALDAPASAFSHCALVTAIDADAGGAAYSSWEGLLYDAAGTTLLRVPAGATDITIREGCTAIAAGALEGCASLATITAPASVTSVSPDAFTSVPTVSLPAASAVADGPGASTGATEEPSEQASSAPVSGSTSTQLTAMVALSSTADDLPEADPSAITVTLPERAEMTSWENAGFVLVERVPQASLDSATVANATPLGIIGLNPNGGSIFIAGGQWGSGANLSSVFVYFYGNLAFTGGVLQFAWFDEYDRYIYAVAQRTGYTLTGWTGTANLPYASYPSTSQVMNWGSGTINETAQWRPNTYTIAFNANGGAGTPPSSIAATYDQSYSIATPSLARSGYTLEGWATSAGGAKAYGPTGPFKNLTATDNGNATLYAVWKANSYTIAFNSQGGSAVPSIGATYDANVTLPASTTRQGYALKGWNTEADGSGASYKAGVALAKPNLTATANGTVTLYAQWEPTISADVPIEVTARVDLLGIEAQEEATGYIESRCGEPLTVADVAFEPLSGATELFGAASVADVALEVLAAGSTSPDARFALDASATQAPASSAAFRMASYGTRVPISYRFAIPDELLPSLVETTKPVCAVAYTVALA